MRSTFQFKLLLISLFALLFFRPVACSWLVAAQYEVNFLENGLEITQFLDIDQIFRLSGHFKLVIHLMPLIERKHDLRKNLLPIRRGVFTTLIFAQFLFEWSLSALIEHLTILLRYFWDPWDAAIEI